MKRTYQPSKIRRQRKHGFVVCLLAVVVKDAKFWLHNPNEYKMENQRKLETAGFFVEWQRRQSAFTTRF